MKPDLFQTRTVMAPLWVIIFWLAVTVVVILTLIMGLPPLAATPREPSLNKCGTLIPRDDQKLVQVVEELRSAANGHCAELKIVEIPNDVEWKIEKAGGVEHVSEIHRTWS